MNVAAKVNSQAFFNCTVNTGADDFVMWEYDEHGSDTDMRIYTGRSENTDAKLLLPEKFGIESNDTTGEYNLIIKDVQLDLAVRYICILARSAIKETAELVAVGMLYGVLLTANFMYSINQEEPGNSPLASS